MSAQDPFAQDPIQPQSRLSGRKLLADALKNFVFSFSQGLAAQAQYPGRRGSQAGMAAALGGPQLLAQIEEQRRQQAQDQQIKLETFRQQVRQNQLQQALSTLNAVQGSQAPEVRTAAPQAMPMPIPATLGAVGETGQRVASPVNPQMITPPMPSPQTQQTPLPLRPVPVPGYGNVQPISAQQAAIAKMNELRQAAAIQAENRPTPEPRNIDPLSAQGIQAAVERTRREQALKPPPEPDKLLPGRDVPLSPEVERQQIRMAGAQAAARRTGAADVSPLVEAVIANPELYNQLTPTIKGSIAPQLNALGFTAFGKPLSESAIQKITESEVALESLKDLREIVKENEQYIGPLAGLQALNPYSEGRKAQADIDRVRQRVGKALEGGVLRKEDEDKYKKILATLRDVPETALYKIDSLQKDVQRQIDIFKTEQSKAGRNVSQPAGDTVKVRAKDGTTGTIPRANLPEAIKRGATEVK